VSGSFNHVSFHVGPDVRVRCATYPDQVPILSLDARGITVSITPDGRDATDEALEFARALAREVGAFAAEVERMHAARHADAGGSTDDGTTKATESKAA
jgi:hypothetical protein